jgi:putative OPT family oligopeptide transporter
MPRPERDKGGERVAQTISPKAFKPFVPDTESPAELTLRALAVGSLLGLVFGASSVYLALRVGLTVSASVPIAVISITLFRAFSKALGGRASILENTVVQTTGSAGESIAAGVAFTLPALVLLGFRMDWTRTLVLSLCGGILGVLMMIPLRRYLIVKEHGVLTYPEGTACAEVLIAGEEKGGAQAGFVFKGLFVGLAFKLVTWVLKFWKTVPEFHIPKFKGAQLSCDISPELLGVGYIIGYRSSAIMVGGGLLSWLVLIPAITLFGEGRGAPLYPGTMPISEMSAGDIWNFYIRYIGAGAVAAGGIINLVKAMPTIVDSFRASLRDLSFKSTGMAGRARTERDLPVSVVLLGSIGLALFMSFLPQLRAVPGFAAALLSAVVIVVFGFFFSVVSSRITGELGSSSNPVSGMAIATLMGTCLMFVLLGWTGHAYTAAALSIGAVVCIASSNAGTTSQDLKTSFLVGGTPWRQQIAIIVGVVTSVIVIGATIQLINANNTRIVAATYPVVLTPADDETRTAPDGARYAVARAGGLDGIPDGAYLVDGAGQVRFRVQEGIGSEQAPAPQATLMSLVIKGILTQKLPWGLVLLGVFTAILMEIIGVPALAFAVGMYLPLESTTPIFLGGLARALVDRSRARAAVASGEGASAQGESDAGPGVLYSSGLVAGGSIMGLAASFLNFPDDRVKRVADMLGFGNEYLPEWLAFAAFCGLAYLIYRTAIKAEQA